MPESKTPMGLVTELFRRMPGVQWSRHPVYRISALTGENVAVNQSELSNM